MIEVTAIIGDIHGNVRALAGMLHLIEGKCDRVIFAGDYVNRGRNSADVLQTLVNYSRENERAIFIEGNHDRGFLECLDAGAMTEFLRIGGAATIRSYLSSVDPDVLEQLRISVPDSHVAFLRSLTPHFADGQLLVTHTPEDAGLGLIERQYHVFGHVPQLSLLPTVKPRWAAIDTGCGTLPEGRLTCLLWPSLEVLQVGADGEAIGF